MVFLLMVCFCFFFLRFLLQLVGILLEDIVTKQLKVDMNEQQHTFYCQELGTLLMCLIHIFKSGNTWNIALCCCLQRGNFVFWDNCWMSRCLRHSVYKEFPKFLLMNAGSVFHIPSLYTNKMQLVTFHLLLDQRVAAELLLVLPSIDLYWSVDQPNSLASPYDSSFLQEVAWSEVQLEYMQL